MDECQLACYPRSVICSLRGSVCCVLLTFSPMQPHAPLGLKGLKKIYPLQTPSHDQNQRCCSPLRKVNMSVQASVNCEAFWEGTIKPCAHNTSETSLF